MSWEEQVKGFNIWTQTRFFHLDKYSGQAALVMEQENEVGVPNVLLVLPRNLKTVKPCSYCY